MTDQGGLRYRKEEWQALTLRWDKLPESEREWFKDQMTRAQWRRFQLSYAKEVEGKTSFEHKLATRKDVIELIALYDDRLRLTARIVEFEAWMEYQRLPWHRKLRVAILAKWAGFLMWLESKGVRLVKLEETDGEGEDRVLGGALGEAEGGAGHTAGELPGGPEDGRLRGRPGGGLADGSAPEGGASRGAEEEASSQEAGQEGKIQVVRR